MYKMNKDKDAIIRISDNKQIAPCNSAQDIDFLMYIEWVEQGNQPEFEGVEDE